LTRPRIDCRVWVYDTHTLYSFLEVAGMSRGKPKVVVRLDHSLMEQVRDAVERRNAGHVTAHHWDVSAYVRQAIVDKLKHDKRSRSRRRATSAISEQASREVEDAFLNLERVIPQILLNELDEEMDAIEASVRKEFEESAAQSEPSSPIPSMEDDSIEQEQIRDALDAGGFVV